MKSVPFDRRENGTENEEAAKRPTSFLCFFGFQRENRNVASGGGKVGNLLLVFHFPMAAKPGCGNVGISRFLRDFQGTVERVGKLLLLFHAFHRPGISIAPWPCHRNRGGSGVWTLQSRSSRALAAFICRAHSVSLIAIASRSSCVKLFPGLRYCSICSSDFSFSNGVR
jgi:hypothetical protein